MADNNSTIKRLTNATTQPTYPTQNIAKPNQLNEQSIANFFIQEEGGNYVITKPLNKDEIINLAKYIITAQFKRGEPMNNPETVKNFLFLHTANFEREVFGVLFLDNANQVICYEDLFFGQVNNAIVYPREVAKKALQYNASAVIIAHNHTSAAASVTPSTSDKEMTIQLKEALDIFGIRVLDHIITSRVNTISFKDLGLI